MNVLSEVEKEKKVEYIKSYYLAYKSNFRAALLIFKCRNASLFMD